MPSPQTPDTRASYLVLVLVLCAMALLGLLAFMAYGQLYEQRRDLSAEADQELADRLARAASRNLQEVLSLGRGLASAPPVTVFCQDPAAPEPRRYAERILEGAQAESKGLFAALSLMYLPPDPSKSLVLRHGGEDRSVPYGASMLDSIGGASVAVGGLDLNYVKAIHEGASSFVGEARLDVLPGLPPLFIIAVPVRDGQGRPVAILAIGVRLDTFYDRLVEEVRLGRGAEVLLLDQRGVCIGGAHRQDVLARSLLKEIGRLPESTVGRPGPFVTDSPAGPVRNIVVPVSFPQPMASPWRVLLQRPESTIRTAVEPERNMLLAVAGLGGLFLLGLGALVPRLFRHGLDRALEREREQCWDNYPGHAPYPVFLVSPEAVIRDANPAASTLFGYTREELSGRMLSSLLPDLPPGILPSAAPEPNITGLEENIFSARNVEHETIFVRAVSREVDADTYLVFARNVTDIVQHRQISEELSRELQQSYKKSELLRAEADKATRAKHDFLANMSHGIRTPLNALLGMSHLLLGAELNERQKNYAKKIDTAARSLLGIVDAIMEFAQIEAGKMDLEVVPLNLPGILESLHNRFGRLCREKGIALDMHLEHDVPEGLMGDPVRLRQVLGHLLSNAVNFTHSGGVSLDCRLEERGNSMATLRFTVQDSGVGISDEQMDMLFNPFPQAENLSTRSYAGAGLGLVICRRMMELMGGSISVQSAPGKGSIFTLHCPFILPVGKDEAQSAAGAASAFALIEDPEKAAQTLKGRSILLVEDNDINQEIAVELLEQTGARVTVAENGAVAVNLVRESLVPHDDGPPTIPFDLILMDIQMPVMDGYTASRTLREMGVTTPILAMTARAFVEERARCLAAGMNDHISKPVEIATLYTIIARWLRRGEQQAKEE